MDENRVREIAREELESEKREIQNIRQILYEELEHLIKTDRFTFQRRLQILDGRHIQLGGNVGTKIGTATSQKIGFFGATPVTQQTDPGQININTVSGTADDSTINDNFSEIANKLSGIRTADKNLGLLN